MLTCLEKGLIQITFRIYYIYTNKKLVCKNELINNQVKRVTLVKIISIISFNKLLLSYYTFFYAILCLIYICIYLCFFYLNIFFIYNTFIL